MFYHPEIINCWQVVKKSLVTFVNKHLNKLNLEVTDLDTQFSDGVYLCLLTGLLEGYFVPLYEFHLTPQVFTAFKKSWSVIQNEPLRETQFWGSEWVQKIQKYPKQSKATQIPEKDPKAGTSGREHFNIHSSATFHDFIEQKLILFFDYLFSHLIDNEKVPG